MSAINGFNTGFSIKQTGTSDSRQSATPSFTNNRVWNSLGDFTKAVQKYESEWKSAYSGAFSRLENGGKITVGELREQMRAEFGSYGVKFIDNVPDDPKAGQNLIHIDEPNLQKMANDPEYRAQAFAVIQAELVSTKGYSFKQNGGTVSSSLTGTVISISDQNSKSRGGVPYSGMATGMSMQSGPASSGGAVKSGKGKSMLEIIKDAQKKRLEEKGDEEKREAARIKREEMLEALQPVDATETPDVESGHTDLVNGEQSPTISTLPGSIMDIIG